MLPGTRDGRTQTPDGPVTRGDPCGHLHKSPQEAGRCAENLAARLNPKPMPSDYYLGRGSRSTAIPRERRDGFRRRAVGSPRSPPRSTTDNTRPGANTFNLSGYLGRAWVA